MNTAPKSLITKDKHCKNCGGAGFHYLSFYHPMRGYKCMCCGTIKPEPDKNQGTPEECNDVGEPDGK